MKNNVTHPSHYNSGKIEVIEAIEDWGLGFHLGNVVKYVARAGKKDASKEVEDLEKASWYLKRKIEILKAKAENHETVRPNDMNPKSTSATPASSSNASAPISGFAPNAKQPLEYGKEYTVVPYEHYRALLKNNFSPPVGWHEDDRYQKPRKKRKRK